MKQILFELLFFSVFFAGTVAVRNIRCAKRIGSAPTGCYATCSYKGQSNNSQLLSDCDDGSVDNEGGCTSQPAYMSCAFCSSSGRYLCDQNSCEPTNRSATEDMEYYFCEVTCGNDSSVTMPDRCADCRQILMSTARVYYCADQSDLANETAVTVQNVNDATSTRTTPDCLLQWNRLPMKNSVNGLQNDYWTLYDCFNFCRYKLDCVAIDFNSNQPDGSPCWVHTNYDDLSEENTYDADTTDQYRMNRTCPAPVTTDLSFGRCVGQSFPNRLWCPAGQKIQIVSAMYKMHPLCCYNLSDSADPPDNPSLTQFNIFEQNDTMYISEIRACEGRNSCTLTSEAYESNTINEYCPQQLYETNYVSLTYRCVNAGLSDGEWMYPALCNLNSSCTYKASWVLDVMSDVVTFTIVAKQPSNTWTAIGFAPEKRMENVDVAYGYLNSRGEAIVVDGWIGTRYTTPTKDSNQNFMNSSITYQDGYLTLKFSRNRRSSDSNDYSFTDTDCYYFLLPVGGGSYFNDDGAINRHFNTPFISDNKICVAKNTSETTSTVQISSSGTTTTVRSSSSVTTATALSSTTELSRNMTSQISISKKKKVPTATLR